MPKSYIRSHQISENAALQRLGAVPGASLDTLLADIDSELDFPFRLSAAQPADSKLYISASQIINPGGTEERIAFNDSSMESVVASWIDFQAKGTIGAHFTATFPSTTTIGNYTRCFIFKAKATGIYALFSSEEGSIGALQAPTAATEAQPEDYLLGWIDLEATAADGRFKSAGSTTSIIENNVGGTARVFHYTNRSSCLAMTKVTAATSPTTTDDSYRVGHWWVRMDTNQAWILTDNTPSSAVWQEMVPVNISPLTAQTLSGPRVFADLITGESGFKVDSITARTDNLQLMGADETVCLTALEGGGIELGATGFAGTHTVFGSLIIGTDLTVTGDLTVNGTTFTANTQTVLVEDNLLVINSGETGAGVTSGTAGIEVERGTETNYQFLFDETQDNFRVGLAGTLQAVATREDSPTTAGVSYWNGTSYRFDTDTDFTWDSTNDRLSAKSVRVASDGYLEFGGVTSSINLNGTHMVFRVDGMTLLDLYKGTSNIITIGDESIGTTNIDNGLLVVKGQTGQLATFQLIDAAVGNYYEIKAQQAPNSALLVNSWNGTSTFEHIKINNHTTLELGRVGNYVHVIRGTGALALPTSTTTNRDLLTPAAGNIRHNTTTSVIEFYSGSAWNNLATETYVNNRAAAMAIVLG